MDRKIIAAGVWGLYVALGFSAIVVGLTLLFLGPKAFGQSPFVTQSDEWFELPPGEYVVPARDGEPEHEYRGDLGERVNFGQYSQHVLVPAVGAQWGQGAFKIMGLAISIALCWLGVRKILGAFRRAGDPEPIDPYVWDKAESPQREQGRGEARREPHRGIQNGQVVEDWRTREESRKARRARLAIAAAVLSLPGVASAGSLTIDGLEAPQIRVDSVWVDPPAVSLKYVWPFVDLRDAATDLRWLIDLSEYSTPTTLGIDFVGVVDVAGVEFGEFQFDFPKHSFTQLSAVRVPEPDLPLRFVVGAAIGLVVMERIQRGKVDAMLFAELCEDEDAAGQGGGDV